jgi:hypothetical protein
MTYIILNSNGRIHTISEKNDTVLNEDQTLETSELSMQDFVDSLPGSPHDCVKTESGYVLDELPKPVIYSAQALKNWAMQQIFTAELIPHFAAFLDFANVATDDAKVLFLTYATAVGLTETANIIVAKAVELGANITL